MNFRRALWIFLLGTMMAGFGWWLERKGIPENVLFYTLAGHSLQVVGAFMMLLSPDDVIDDSEFPVHEGHEDSTAYNSNGVDTMTEHDENITA